MENLVINSFSMFPTFPQPSGPYISGLLKANNVSVKQLDIGVELWDYILSQEYLSNIKYSPEVLHKFPCDLCPKLSLKEFKETQLSLLDNILIAKDILRNKELFFDFSKLNFAFDTIFQAQTLIYHQYGTLLTNHLTYWPYMGFDVKSLKHIYDLSMDRSLNPFIQLFESKIIPKILEINPSLIMIEFMFPWEIVQVLTLNILIKQHLPNVHINFPGIGFDEVAFSRIKENLIRNSKFFFGYDSIFLRKNEHGLIKLNKSHLTNDWQNISDLTYACNNEVVINDYDIRQAPQSAQIEDYYLNFFPDYTGLPLKKYFAPYLVIIDKTSSRCFWGKCNYCSINSNFAIRQEFSLDYITEKFKYYKEQYNSRHLFLLDEACTPEFASKLADKLIQSDINIIWSIRTRIDPKFDHTLLEKMYNAGCRELWIGLESVDSNILTMMNKTSDPANYSITAAKILNFCSDIGIGIHFCFILGFPSETKEQREKLISFFENNITALKKMPFFATFNTFCLMPQSTMYNQPHDFGITEVTNNIEEYNMTDVPYKTRFNDDTRSSKIKYDLEQFRKELLKVLVYKESLYLSWFNVADSAYELLLKEHYAKIKKNPFLVEL